MVQKSLLDYYKEGLESLENLEEKQVDLDEMVNIEKEVYNATNIRRTKEAEEKYEKLLKHSGKHNISDRARIVEYYDFDFDEMDYVIVDYDIESP